MMHKTYLETKLDEVQDLVSDWNHDRLSLGVVKAIHCLDITEHVEASGKDDKQQQCGEQTDPDGHCEESYTVPGRTKGGVARSVIKEGFHLEILANQSPDCGGMTQKVAAIIQWRKM